MYSTKVVSSDIPPFHVFILSRAMLLAGALVVLCQVSPSKGDTYAGDRLDPFFTARPNPIQNYGQWGHYPILYQDPNRPLEPINKYDPRYSAVTPDTFNRYKIEDPGDLRCPEAVREGESFPSL